MSCRNGVVTISRGLLQIRFSAPFFRGFAFLTTDQEEQTGIGGKDKTHLQSNNFGRVLIGGVVNIAEVDQFKLDLFA